MTHYRVEDSLGLATEWIEIGGFEFSVSADGSRSCDRVD